MVLTVGISNATGILYTDILVPVVIRIFTSFIWFGIQAVWFVYSSPLWSVLMSVGVVKRQEYLLELLFLVGQYPCFLRIPANKIRLRTHEELLLRKLPPLNERLYRPRNLVRGFYTPRPHSPGAPADSIRYIVPPLR